MKLETMLASGRLGGAEAGRLLVQDFVESYRDFMAGGDGSGLMSDVHFQMMRRRITDDEDVRQYNGYVAGCRFFQHLAFSHHVFSSRLDMLVMLLWHAVSRLQDTEREYARKVHSPRIVSRAAFNAMKKDGIDTDLYPGGVAVLAESTLSENLAGLSDSENAAPGDIPIFDEAGNYRHPASPVWTHHLAETFLATSAAKLPPIYRALETTLAEVFVRHAAMRILIDGLAVPDLELLLPPAYDTTLLDALNAAATSIPGSIIRHGLLPAEKPVPVLQKPLSRVLRPIPYRHLRPTDAALKNAQNAFRTLLLDEELSKILEILRGNVMFSDFLPPGGVGF